MIITLFLMLQLAGPSLPAWITIAPGIQAQPNLTIGEAAYNTCIMTANADTIVCQTARSAAIRNDMEQRFVSLFHDLVKGQINDTHSLDVYLQYYQMRLTPLSPTIPTPFGPIVNPAPTPNPVPNPFPG